MNFQLVVWDALAFVNADSPRHRERFLYPDTSAVFIVYAVEDLRTFRNATDSVRSRLLSSSALYVFH